MFEDTKNSLLKTVMKKCMHCVAHSSYNNNNNKLEIKQRKKKNTNRKPDKIICRVLYFDSLRQVCAMCVQLFLCYLSGNMPLSCSLAPSFQFNSLHICMKIIYLYLKMVCIFFLYSISTVQHIFFVMSLSISVFSMLFRLRKWEVNNNFFNLKFFLS